MRRVTSKNSCGGFTLVELIIVVTMLAILAALVVPKFTDASTRAQAAATQDQLRSIRTVFERYKIDHADSYPDIDALWGVMTSRTDADGTLNVVGDFGPYLKSAPKNPFTGSSNVVDFGDGTATDGWEYDVTETPVIIAVGFNESTQTYTAP